VITLGDDQDGTILDTLATELPLVGDADAELLHLLRLRRRDDQHGELAAL